LQSGFDKYEAKATATARAERLEISVPGVFLSLRLWVSGDEIEVSSARFPLDENLKIKVSGDSVRFTEIERGVYQREVIKAL
jgi:hypothetical protein